jgi:hypothetical protein
VEPARSWFNAMRALLFLAAEQVIQIKPLVSSRIFYIAVARSKSTPKIRRPKDLFS